MSDRSSHEHYEQLCVMASVGEISEAAHAELHAHLNQCFDCRAMLADMQCIHANWFPQRPGFEMERDPTVEGKNCRRILNRANVENDLATLVTSNFAPRRGISSKRSWMSAHSSLSIAASILIVLGISGAAARVALYYRNPSQTPKPAVAVEPQNTAKNTSVESRAREVTSKSLPSQQAEESQTTLEAAQKEWHAERELLEQRLNSALDETSKLRLVVGDLTQTSSQASLKVTDLQQQLELVRAHEAKVEAELANFKSSKSDREAELILARADNQDLHAKLAAQSGSIERERDLLSGGRDVRDLIAARNLHIIDVYDTTEQGKTQRAFGRVFFTEGKSLVFYAYDLSPRHSESKYAYYAWGKRDDKQGGIRKLGIFLNDDQSQKRWVLQINDPQTLSTIDSVFVTLEHVDSSGQHPTGQQVLSAYLGSSPNHP